MSPDFRITVTPGSELMVWEQGKSTGSGKICGQSYANDLEKARLLQRERNGCAKANRDQTNPVSVGAKGATYDVGRLKELIYPISVGRRRTNLDTFATKLATRDPKGGTELRSLITQSDVIAAMGRELAPYGLRVDNLADAYTVWWMNAWQAAHGDTSPPDRDQAQAVKAQAARALLATPEVTAATDAQKQEFAEALLVQAALISASQEKYKDDATQTRRLAAAVRQGAKASGVDLDAMTLTPQGFVPADTLGAADTPSAPGTSPLLLAAAGGVGLGGVFLLGRAAGRRG